MLKKYLKELLAVSKNKQESNGNNSHSCFMILDENISMSFG